MCSDCAQPKDVAYNPDAEGWFEAREIVCAGCAARQQHGGEDKKPTPGGKLYVVDTRPADVELKPWRLPSGSGADHDARDDEADPEHTE